eukprot:5271704-Pleurochrysis_carterae.AAC.1
MRSQNIEPRLSLTTHANIVECRRFLPEKIAQLFVALKRELEADGGLLRRGSWRWIKGVGEVAALAANDA